MQLSIRIEYNRPACSAMQVKMRVCHLYQQKKYMYKIKKGDTNSK